MPVEIVQDGIRMSIYDNREEMGTGAAKIAAGTIRQLLLEQEAICIVFAAAPSQTEFLTALQKEPLDWSRVHAFHMDEYLGLEARSAQTFAYYLETHLFEKLPLRSVHYLDGNAIDPAAECLRYADLLQQQPPDIVCMGIGENNHIAFNDPLVADFNDPETVKIVNLDEDCRRQQVNDGCFPSLQAVPTRAITLTVPALLSSRYIFCMVPGERKAKAVYHTVNSPVTERYPSTILRQHRATRLFLDKDSSKMLGL